MSKVMFISDMHLSPRIPISRKDNYPETLLTKLQNTHNLAKQNKVSDIIFLGDLFNTRHMTLSYFIKCFQIFKNIQEDNIKLHLIIGNHDILFNNEDMTQESPIQLLLDSKVFDNNTFTIDDCSFNLFNYTTNTSDLPKAQPNGYNILVGHYFYAVGFNDTEHTITKDQCSDLQYNSYILGHDHTPYEVVKTKNYEVHRPGSFSRATSQTCQVNRDNVQVIIFDTKTHSYEYLNIPNVLPSSDIYKETNLISKLDFSTLTESLQSLLQDLNFDNSSDIFQTLNSIPMDEQVRQLITKYLNSEGVYDTTGGDTTCINS